MTSKRKRASEAPLSTSREAKERSPALIEHLKDGGEVVLMRPDTSKPKEEAIREASEEMLSRLMGRERPKE